MEEKEKGGFLKEEKRGKRGRGRKEGRKKKRRKEEILARRGNFGRKSWLGEAILGANHGFGGNFSLRDGSVRGTNRLPGMFFLSFFYSFFYTVFLLSCIYISHLIYSLIILFSL